MALGDITAKLTDIRIDRSRLQVTWMASRFQEDSDGTLNMVETEQVSQTFPNQGAIASLTVLQLFNQGVTLMKAAYTKMPNTIG